MGAIVQLRQDLVTLTCWAREGCGIQFAVPLDFKDVCSTHGASFFCPRGHKLSYGESEVAKLQKEVERERRRREWAETNEKTARHAEAIAQGKLKAQSERVKNGVCPCCKRSFTNLRRHMNSKHPDFAK